MTQPRRRLRFLSVLSCLAMTAGPFGADLVLGECWRSVPSRGLTPGPRVFPTMAFDEARERLVLIGGVGFRDTWEWDDERWSQADADGGDRIRAGAAAAFVEGCAYTLLFGGGFTGETSAWDGESWSEVSPDGAGPSARSWPAMSHDPSRQEVLLFGGEPPSMPGGLADTWRWEQCDGWAAVPSAASPPGRTQHAMAYDPSRDEHVLFGGREGSGGALLGDTWVFGAQGWEQRFPTQAPEAREHHVLVYSPELGAVVLVGGLTIGGAVGDVWLWDGSDWSPGPSGLSARYGAAAAYTSARGSVVLYGGQSPDGELSEFWQLGGEPAEIVCSGVSACPGGRFVYKVSACNDTGSAAQLRGVVSGPGVSGSPQLFSEVFPDGESFRRTPEIRTPPTLPSVCPTTLTIDVTLDNDKGITVGTDRCLLDFEPLE